MFTEGLDENAINWIKKGSSNLDHDQPRVRSPLAENLSPGRIPRSPLPFNSAGNFVSPHGLPPLKFHSSLLAPRSLVVSRLSDDEDDEEDEESESVASVSNDGGGGDFSNYNVEDEEEEEMVMAGRCYDEEEVFGYRSNSKLNRRLLNERSLRIEIPNGNRRVTDGELGLRKFAALKDSTPVSCLPGERAQPQNSQGYSFYQKSMLGLEDMGTPSAPPIMETTQEEKGLGMAKETEEREEGICGQGGFESHRGSTGSLAGDCSSNSVRDEEVGERYFDC